HALERVLAQLPADFGLPVVVAQHRDADADAGLLPSLLDHHSALTVADAEDKSPLEPGRVLLGPPGYHIPAVAPADPAHDRGWVSLSVDDPVQFARPSIDVLFQSAAEAFGPRAIGVVLTGSNADGAEGLAAIARRGGLTVVQDPGTAERAEMPRAALAALDP